MASIFTNWRTTSAGIAAILVAAADLIHPASGAVNLNGDITAILAGLGLIFSRDHNT